MTLQVKPHDLLWVNAVIDTDTVPEWFSIADLLQRPVVVRRAVTTANHIAVGLRGYTRSQRYANVVAIDAVRRTMTPEQLVEQQGWYGRMTQNPLPHWQTLATIAECMHTLGLTWGITGSLGFELATNIATANHQSDIDLRLCCPQAIDKSVGFSLMEQLNRLAQRPDIQIETPTGAFAINEWLSSSSSVLLKTARGPIITATPWADSCS
ncbi:malonate decarboxylase holo-ACP synthase [Shewanella sp.]|uniref:malonate decarboxylase holo-ACP synthase n=1 Tax=Shewanella sp. TaxID=50422 RepID=UPI003A97233C